MRIDLYLLTLGLGVVLAVHLAMNGKVGSMLENPRVANAVFWCIGALTALLIGWTGWKAGPTGTVRRPLATLRCRAKTRASTSKALARSPPPGVPTFSTFAPHRSKQKRRDKRLWFT